MPRQKQKSFLEKIKAAEPTASFILGLIVVLAIGGLAGRYLYQHYSQQKPKGQVPLEASKNIVSPQTNENKNHQYQVKSGDNLWKIAEHFYQSGYNWVDIAKANKLASPNVLNVNTVLIIPNVKTRKPTSPTNIKTLPVISNQQSQYIVQKGDSLSLIALRAYGDMFAWPKLWKANKGKIVNPWLIYPGQTLKIPRP